MTDAIITASSVKWPRSNLNQLGVQIHCSDSDFENKENNGMILI